MDLRRRRDFLQGSLALAGLGLLAGCGLPLASGQPPPRVPSIGYLGLSSGDENFEAFRDGLRELGYVAGQTVVIEERWAASPADYSALAAELVGLPVDLIVTAGGPATQAALGATRTIPIVFAATGDPVAAGYAASLARPGGNATGSSNLQAQIQGKHLQLLREMLPTVARVMYLTDTGPSEASGGLQAAQQAAQSLGLALMTPPIRNAADLAAALRMAAQDQAEALMVTGTPLMLAERGRIVEFALAGRLPLIAQDRSFAMAGGLSSYGPNTRALYRRAAVYVDKILKDANPADLPVEQPAVFDFIISLRTAQTLGLTIPESVLQQATELIQ